MAERLERAIDLFRSDPARWRNIQQNAFRADFSWGVSARRHLEVYRWAVRRKRARGPAAG